MVIINIDPVSKPRQTRSDKWKKRPCVVRYREFADEMRRQCGDFVLPDTVTVKFFVKMPDSWSKKKKEKMNGTKHQQKPDIDNYIKAVFDCLAKDDSYIWHVVALKKWAYEGKIVIY